MASKKPVDRASAFSNVEGSQEQWQWVQDEEQGYREAKVLKANPDGSIMVEIDGASKLVKKDQLGPPVLSRADINSDYPDMVRMADVNEATILRNLKTRFFKDLIYTNIGTILVALNPFKRIDCYGKKFAEEHKNTPPGEQSDPHVFQTAANAYRGKSVERRNQSIIISGESGAGKTEATKHCLQYFAMVAGSAEGNMQDKLLAANPVLEAFGNAKTVRNNNSSRFGKWMEVHFDGRFAICGCQILNYLLEKSRIVFQTNLERNYHIFYMLPRASDPELLRMLGLTRDPAHYGYTKNSYLKDDINDKAEFEDVKHSFAALEFGAAEYEPLYMIVAGLLHMSNIEFNEIDEDSCKIDGVSPASTNGLAEAARLLGMDAEELQKGLTEKLIVARSERVNSPLSAAKANNARDSLSKALYGRMFDWLVKQVNSKMDKALPGAGGIIGVLDIFGFEIFVNNSFEQLCINFCNEKLQQHFNYHVFKQETTTYIAEEITFSEVKFVDNQDVLDMVELKPDGLLVMLDDECRVPKGSDLGYLEKIKKTHHLNPRFAASVPKAKPSEFGVNHYAGRVVYNVESFMEKNKDELLLNIQNLLETSRVPFIKSLFVASGGGGGGGGAGGAEAKVMQGQQFRNQLDALMATLNATDPGYIRCIKSNSAKKSGIYESSICLTQLRYAGVFEAVRVRQLGFPFRYKHAIFYMRYRCICYNLFILGDAAYDPKFLAKLPPGGLQSSEFPFKAKCKELLDYIATNMSPEKITPVDKVFKFGKTMMLYRADQSRRLDALRQKAQDQAALEIQRVFRAHRVRKTARKMRAQRETIRAAIRARDYALVKAANVEAKKLPFRLAEMRVLDPLEKLLAKEAKLVADLQALLPLEPVEHTAAYEKALAEGKVLADLSRADAKVFEGSLALGQHAKVDPEKLMTAHPAYMELERKFASVEQRKKAKEELEATIARGDIASIQEALRKAGEAGDDLVSQADRQRAAEAIAAMERDAEVLKMITTSVVNGRVGGQLGNLLVGTIKTEDLEAVERGISSGAYVSSTPRFRTLASTVAIMLKLRRKLKVALEAPSSAAWRDVGAEVRAANELKTSGALAKEADEEVVIVEKEVRDREVQESLKEGMARGAAAGALGAMVLKSAQSAVVEAAVKAADAIKSDGLNLSFAAEKLLSSARRVWKLRDAQFREDWKAIGAVIDEAFKEATLLPLAMAEFGAAKDELNNHNIIRELERELSSGSATGSAGMLNTDVIVLPEKSIKLATELGPKTAQAQALLTCAHCVLRLRRALLAADVEAAGAAQGQAILSAVEQARRDVPREYMPPFTHDQELVVAEAHGRNLLLVATLRDALITGCPSGAVGRAALPPVSPTNNKIAEALALCKQVRVKNGEALQLERAVLALKEVRDAFVRKDWVALGNAVENMKCLEGSRYSVRAATLGEDAGVVIKSKPVVPQRVGGADKVAAAEERAAKAGEGGGGGGAFGEEGGTQWTASRRALMLNAKKRLSDGTSPAAGNEDMLLFYLPPESHAELSLFEDEVNNYKIVTSLQKALGAGCATGALGALARDAIDTDALSFALKKHQLQLAKFLKTPLACALYYTGSVVRDLRSSIKEGDWVSVENTLKSVGANNFRLAYRLGKPLPAGAMPAPAPSPDEARPRSMSGAFDGRPRSMSGALSPGASSPRPMEGVGHVPTSITEPLDVSPHAEVPDLSAALELAKITLVQPGFTEVVRVEAEAAYRRVIEGMLNALNTGAASGKVGAINLDTLSVGGLAAQIDAARALGARTPRAQQLSVLCRLMWQVRTAVSEVDWAAVESLLLAGAPLVAAAASAVPTAPGAADAAPLLPGIHAELKLYSEEASNRRVMAALRTAILSGGPVGSVGKLVLSSLDIKGLEDAVRAGLATGTVTEEAAQLLASAVHLRALRLCLEGGSWQRLGELLDYAASSRTVAKAYSMSSAAAAAGKAAPGGAPASGGAPIFNTPDGKGSMGYWPGVVDPEVGFDLARCGMAPEMEAEVALLQRELTNRTVIARLVAALGVGAPRGDVGHLDFSELSTVELDRALDFALAAGVVTAEAEMLVATAQLVRRTRQALGHSNWGALEEALNGARGKLLAEAGMQEVQRSQWELDDRLQREELTAAMGKGRPQGRVGRLFIAAIDVKPLNAAVGLSSRLGPRSPEAVQLLFTGKVIARLRACLMADNIAEASVTLDAVAGKLLAPVAMPEVLAVKEEVENWKLVSLLSAAIQTGCATGVPGALDTSHVDTSGLERALSQADDFGVKTAEAQTLYATASLLVRIRRALLDGHWGATTDALQAETAAALAAAAGGAEGAAGGALSLAQLRPEEEGEGARDTVERLLTEASASALPLSDLALPELVLLRSEVANQRAVLTFSLVLSRGGATGAPGALDVSRVDLAELDAALADVAAMGVHTENAARLVDAARLIRRLRSTLLSGNWKWVGSVLLDARGMRNVLPHKSLRELQVAQDELDNRALLAQINGALAEGAVGGPVGKLDTASVNTGALDDAISFARTLGVKSTEAATALATALLVRRLRGALRTADFAGAKEALDAAAGKPRAPAAEAELALVSTSVDNWRVVTELRHACASGAPAGPLLAPDPGTIHTEALDGAIATTMRLGVHSSEARVAMSSALVARRLREAQLNGDYDFMRAVVGEAGEVAELLPSVAPEVARAKASLEFRELLEKLSAAAAARDTEALEAGLAAVRALLMAVPPAGAQAAALTEAAALLDSLRVCVRDLAVAAQRHSVPGLAEALAHARSLNLRVPAVEEGARTLAKLERLTAAAGAALAAMDAHLMAAALREADAEGVNLPPIPALRDALALPRPQFLRKELDTVLEAIASGSPNREAAVTAAVERAVGEGGAGAGSPAPSRAPPGAAESAYLRRVPTPAELRVINATMAIKDVIFADLPPTDDVISSALAASAAAGLSAGFSGAPAPPPLPPYPTAPSGTAAAAEAAAARLNDTLSKHPAAAPAIARLRAQRHMDENVQGAALRVTMSVLRTATRPLFAGLGERALKFSPSGYRDGAAPANRLPSQHPGFVTAPAPGAGLGEATPPASSLLRRTYGLHFFRAVKPPHMLSSRFASTMGIAESRILCWQHEPLSTSLTLLASADARLLAVRSFRGILAFMGDRPLSQPLQAGADVLRMAATRPDVRDEVYLQLMKQLTDTASAAAAERGWVLLYALLTAVPPSEEFENYLELWLREQGATPAVWALHLTLYRNGPGAEGVPGAAELLALLEKCKAPVLPMLSQLGADAGEGGGEGAWLEEDRLSAAQPQRNNAALEALQTGALTGASASNLFLRIGAVNSAVLAAQTGLAPGRELSEHEDHALQVEFQRSLGASGAPRQPPPAAARGAALAYLNKEEFPSSAEGFDKRTEEMDKIMDKVAALLSRT